MVLTAYIISASDGQLILGVAELPELRAVCKSVDDIEAAVKAEAALLTGHSPDTFQVRVPF